MFPSKILQAVLNVYLPQSVNAVRLQQNLTKKNNKQNNSLTVWLPQANSHCILLKCKLHLWLSWMHFIFACLIINAGTLNFIHATCVLLCVHLGLFVFLLLLFVFVLLLIKDPDLSKKVKLLNDLLFAKF